VGSDQTLFSNVRFATEAPLAHPEGLLLDEFGGSLYVADTGNGLVRRVELATNRIETIVGRLGSTLVPTFIPLPALEVDLVRPIGLALDRERGELFVADAARGQVLAVDLASSSARVVAALGFGFHPLRLAFHRFGAQRRLFVADAGRYPGAFDRRRPELWIGDPDSGNFANLPLSFGPNFEYTSYRTLSDVLLVPDGQGGAHLHLAADIGEAFESYGGSPPFGPIDLRFELDCFNNFDEDFDGLTDFDDPDCEQALQEVILRYEFGANGSLLDSVPTAIVRGARRFPVEVGPVPGCPQTVPSTPPLDYPDLAIGALAITSGGMFACVDTLSEEIGLLDLNGPRPLTVFGTSFALASPFDGVSPLSTRLSRPRAIVFDSLGNLYVADTVHNRIRRAWVGDLLGP
jgi:sugar lactone lactonase YvrE